MEKRVFHYRSALFYILLATTVAWGVTWLILAIAASQTSKVPFQTAWNAFSGFGNFALYLFVGRMLRIEIEEGQIRSFNWMGRQSVQGRLAGNQVRSKVAIGPLKVFEVETDGGKIMFSNLLVGVDELQSLLLKYSAISSSPVFDSFEKTSSVRVYDSRWTALHFVSAFWLLMPIGLAISDYRARHFVDPALIMLGGMLVLYVIYLQLNIWNQKICIGPDGIEWINGFGEVVVRARLDEIQAIHGPSLWRQLMRIETAQGTIRPRVMIRESARLTTDLQRILDRKLR